MPQSEPLSARRPDLGRSALLFLLAATLLGVALVVLIADASPPGTRFRQAAAIAGSLLLMTPAAFAVVKRGGLTSNPPAWFMMHVLASVLGTVLVFLHASGGSFLTPPGVLLVLLVLLVVQGALARAYLPARLAGLFSASVQSFGAAGSVSREQFQALIEEKRALLARLDAHASEAVFSPNLHHWLRHPNLSLRYTKLAAQEMTLVGARRRAGTLLSLWRPLHMLLAWLFVLGVIVHVVLVTFFAGYVAGGEPIYWWHLTAWGGP